MNEYNEILSRTCVAFYDNTQPHRFNTSKIDPEVVDFDTNADDTAAMVMADSAQQEFGGEHYHVWLCAAFRYIGGSR